MAGNDGSLFAERVQQADDVADHVQLRVLVDRLGAVGLAVAALVRGDSVEAGIGERGDLVPPRVPALREAVAHHDERAAAGLGDVHVDAVRLDGAVLDLGHGAWLLSVE